MDNKYRGNRRISHSRIVNAIMAGQIQLAFLLVIVACMVHGAPRTAVQSPDVEGIEIRANLDKTVDALLPSIRKFILHKGMDPMQLIDISEPILPDLPWKFKGNVDLKKGWLQNLSLVKRTQHVTAIYKDKRLTLDLNLGFDVMDFNYKYDLKYLLYKRQGDMYGRAYNLDINTVVTIDLNEYRLILESIKFSNVRKFEVQFQGNLLDSIVNALTKVITVVFPKSILTLVEDHSMKIFRAVIEEWNTLIPLSNRKEILVAWLDIVELY